MEHQLCVCVCVCVCGWGRGAMRKIKYCGKRKRILATKMMIFATRNATFMKRKLCRVES